MSGNHQFECGITLTDVTPEEAGLWTCDVEEYKLGDIQQGEQISSKATLLKVIRKEPLTTTTTTTAPTTSSNPTTTTTYPHYNPTLPPLPPFLITT